MARTKMSRQDRAKQFAPFDALKGLHEALRMKEYQHERVQKGDLGEEKIEEISEILLALEKNDVVDVRYFVDGHYLQKQGAAKIDYIEQILYVGDLKIGFEDIFDIKKLN